MKTLSAILLDGREWGDMSTEDARKKKGGCPYLGKIAPVQFFLRKQDEVAESRKRGNGGRMTEKEALNDGSHGGKKAS